MNKASSRNRWLFLCLGALLLAAPVVRGEVKPELSRLHIIAVSINGSERIAFVDTGCTLCALHGTKSSPAIPNGKPAVLISRTLGGAIPFQLYHDVQFVVPGLDSRQLDVVESNLLDLPYIRESGVQAVVGMNYMHNKVLLLSGCEHCSLTLTAPEQLPEYSMRLNYSREMTPATQLQLPGQRIDVLVDTGSTGYVTLPTTLIRSLQQRGHLAAAGSCELGTATGTITQQLYTLRWVQFGNVRYLNVPVGEGPLASIGTSLLQHLNCVFDFPNSRLYFEPLGDTSPIECQVDASGLRYSFEQDHRAYVRRFWKDYPAEKSGIQVGDEIIAVDGVPVSQLSVHDIDATLCHAGKTVHLDLKSGEREYTVDLKLSRPYEYPPQWEPEQVAPPFPTLMK